MAPYLTTVDVGEWRLRGYEHDGLEMWDAIDPDLLAPSVPRTGSRMAIARGTDLAYQRLTRQIAVPAGGATVSFWVDRKTEPGWDHFLVEARTAGRQDWTTLPDLAGHTGTDPGNACTFWQEIHPFLAHYQTVDGDDPLAPGPVDLAEPAGLDHEVGHRPLIGGGTLSQKGSSLSQPGVSAGD